MRMRLYLHPIIIHSLTAKQKKAWRDRVIVFLMVFLSASFAVTNDLYPLWIPVGLWLVVFILVAYKCRRINRVQIVCFILFLGSMWISLLIHSSRFSVYILYSLSFLTVFLYVNQNDYRDFANAYVFVMTLLSVVSLAFMLLFILFPQLNSTHLIYNVGREYSYWTFFVKTTNSMRNNGMFWEPGAYQTFLSFALLLEANKPKPNVFPVVICALAILTTFSTTGYICLLIVLTILLGRGKKSPMRGVLIIAVTVIALLVALYFFGSFFVSSYNKAIMKINEFIEIGKTNINSGSSASIRFYAMILPIKEFLFHPIFGVGYDALNENLLYYTHNMNTCTFVNWFAVYGIVYGCIVMYGFIRFTRKMNDWLILRLLIFTLLMCMIASENFIHTAFLYSIPFYGWNDSTLQEKPD